VAVECRVATAGARCVEFIDQTNRGVSLAIEAQVSGVEVGSQLSLVDRRSFVGLRTGFTQLQLGIWGRMVFEVGPVDRLEAGREPF
jgi:hypothetical protein